jgi:hypothetical protein
VLFTIPAITTCAVGISIGAWIATVLNEFVFVVLDILIPMILDMMGFMVAAVVAARPDQQIH